MPKNKEIEITLTLKDEATKKIQSFRSGVKEFSTATKDSLTPILQLRQAWRKFGLASTFVVGGLTTAIVQINKLNTQIKEYDLLAIKMGISTESLSKRIYGFNIATANVRIGLGEFEAWKANLNKIKEATIAGGADQVGLIAKYWRAYNLRLNAEERFQEVPSWSQATKEAERQKLSELQKRKESEAIKKGIVDETEWKIRQIVASSYAFKIQLLDQELKAYRVQGVNKTTIWQYERAARKRLEEDYFNEVQNQESNILQAKGRTLEALKLKQQAALVEYKRQWGSDGEATRAFVRAQQETLNQAKYTYLGISSNFSIMRNAYLSTIQSMTSAMGGFYDTTTGEFKSLNEAAVSFGRQVIGIINQMLAQYIVAKAIMGISTIFSGGSRVITGGVGGTTTQTTQFGTTWSPSAGSYHRGGLIRAHSGLAVDEVPIVAQRGEYILSRRGVAAAGGIEAVEKINRGEVSSGMIFHPGAIQINIDAIDSKTGVEFLLKNSDAIAQAIANRMRVNDPRLRK